MSLSLSLSLRLRPTGESTLGHLNGFYRHASDPISEKPVPAYACLWSNASLGLVAWAANVHAALRLVLCSVLCALLQLFQDSFMNMYTTLSCSHKHADQSRQGPSQERKCCVPFFRLCAASELSTTSWFFVGDLPENKGTAGNFLEPQVVSDRLNRKHLLLPHRSASQRIHPARR